MANLIQDGSYILAEETEDLKAFEQELESAHLVGEWQIPTTAARSGRSAHLWKWDFMFAMMRQASASWA